MKFSLFSTLDNYWTNYSFLPSISWFFILVWLLLWFGNMNINKSLKIVMSFINNMVEQGAFLSENFKFKFFNSMIFFVFCLMLAKKLFGLSPYFTSGTSQMVFTFSLACPLWLSLILSQISYKYKYFFSHLVPSGSPLILAPVLVMIELMSSFIRPLTLSLRLAINITTGHMLLSLISLSLMKILVSNESYMSMSMMLLLSSGYMIFEFCMAFIQAFVFSLLCSQYLGEHS